MTAASSGLPRASLADGDSIPLVGLGTAGLLGEDCVRAVGWALEHGYRLVDTATAYGNEDEVGAGVRTSGIPREDVFLTTKLPPERAGRQMETLHQSLAALDVDHLDLWLIHWPPGDEPGVDTWREFIRAKEEGLVRQIGVSNYSSDQIDVLRQSTGVTPAVNQVRWSPLLFEREFLSDMRQRGVVLEAYSPLKGGSLTRPLVLQLAELYGVTPAQILVRWQVQHGVVVIPKSSRRDRIESNADIGGFQLTDEEMESLDALA